MQLHRSFRLHFNATLQLPATRIKNCVIIQIKWPPFWVVILFGIGILMTGNRTHLNATVRWTVAATSANTGGYLDSSIPLSSTTLVLIQNHRTFALFEVFVIT